MMRLLKLSLAAAFALALLGAGAEAQDKPLRIGVSAGPYADILREAAKLAEARGLKSEVIEFTDWPQVNDALQLGDLDFNNFQHETYLNNQKKQRGYTIVPIATSIVVPLGIYSSKFGSLADIPAGARIGIPNDPSNGARALFLLQQAGLIKLKPGVDVTASVADITENPKKFEIVELEAAQLPRALPDLDAAAIVLSHALLAHIDPKTALKLEGADSRWTLVFATREDNRSDPRIARFVSIYRSPEIKDYILAKFGGTILPTW